MMHTQGKGRTVIVEPLEDPVPKRREAKPDPGTEQPDRETIAKPERETVPA